MNIKLIALDLDGTLLNSGKCISNANYEALVRCCESGIYIVPATGRTVDGIPGVIKDIPGVRYAITTNGAVIEDLESGKTLDMNAIPWETALEILELMEGYHVMYDPYIDRRGITEAKFYEHLADYSLDAAMISVVRQTRDVHDNILEFVKMTKKPVEKINLFFAGEEERSKVRRFLEKRSDVVLTSSLPLNLEINAAGVSKGQGLLRLSTILGLKKEETMAIGDGENDISMIREAGMGVAMGNGRSELLQIADYITDTNDEDGVAHAISRFVLEAE